MPAAGLLPEPQDLRARAELVYPIMVGLYQQLQALPQGQAVPQPVAGILPAAPLHLREGRVPQHGYQPCHSAPKSHFFDMQQLVFNLFYLENKINMTRVSVGSFTPQTLHCFVLPALFRSLPASRRRLMSMASSSSNSSPHLGRKPILRLI